MRRDDLPPTTTALWVFSLTRGVKSLKTISVHIPQRKAGLLTKAGELYCRVCNSSPLMIESILRLVDAEWLLYLFHSAISTSVTHILIVSFSEKKGQRKQFFRVSLKCISNFEP